MAIHEYAKLDGVTVGATQVSIISGTTTGQSVADQGIYGLWIDVPGAGLAQADQFAWRIFEKVLGAGGNQRVIDAGHILGNQWDEPLVIPPYMLRNGWDMTLQRIAGADRAFDASIRGVSGPIAQPYTLSAVTVGSTELSIVSATTTLQTVAVPGVYQLFVEGETNMAKSDKFAARIYDKVEGTGGTKRQFYELELHHAQTRLLVSPMFTLIHGWDMTLQRVAGADRAFDASIRRVG